MDIKYGYNHYNETTLSVSYDEIESFCLPSYLALEVGGSESVKQLLLVLHREVAIKVLVGLCSLWQSRNPLLNPKVTCII